MDAPQSDDALFTMDDPSESDDLSGDLSVDATFATAERVLLDETSWVDHVHGWLRGDRVLMRTLMAAATWEQRSRWMYTRTVTEPRLTAEYPTIADAPLPVLHHLAVVLSAHYDRPFTRLWMNWYRDHRDGTGWHSDRPAHLRPEAVIPVLSLGAPRRFLIRPSAGGPSRSFVCRGGDLIVMGGRAQRDHQHCVPKQTSPAGPRLSLNFSEALTG